MPTGARLSEVGSDGAERIEAVVPSSPVSIMETHGVAAKKAG